MNAGDMRELPTGNYSSSDEKSRRCKIFPFELKYYMYICRIII
jgi:hypothetical protein